MSEFGGRLPAEAVLNPAYWGGVDVFDEDLPESPKPELLRAKGREYVKCAREVFKMINLIDTGKYTEVRYEADTLESSSTDLPDGTVVILDSENLAHSPSLDPNSLDELPEVSPPIFWPYADYWRAHRDSQLVLGQEISGFPDRQAVYLRYLNWGVLLTRKDGTRLLQNFNLFNIPSPRFGDFLQIHAKAGFIPPIALPVPIGETLSGRTLDSSAVGRLKQVDVIYPAKASRERKKRKLGMFALKPNLSSGF